MKSEFVEMLREEKGKSCILSGGDSFMSKYAPAVFKKYGISPASKNVDNEEEIVEYTFNNVERSVLDKVIADLDKKPGADDHLGGYYLK